MRRTVLCFTRLRSRLVSRRRFLSRAAITGSLLTLLWSSGCARQPPTSNFLSGVRLHVVMRFASPIQQRYYYFFLINASNDVNAPGPIPVVLPPPVGTGVAVNGFATGSATNTTGTNAGANTGGFTDFVLYSSDASRFPSSPQQNYALVHVRANQDANNVNNFQANGVPVTVTPPVLDTTSADPNAQKIEFEIDMAQLLRDSAGQPITDATEARAMARAIQYIQVNMISTNVIPVDQQSFTNKQTDSMGNTSNGRGTFFTLRLTNSGVVQNATYTNNNVTNINGQDLTETTGDVYAPGGSPDGALDLESWSIEVVDRG